MCVCKDVSVSSLNDGFFLLHTDTEDNSGKVQRTHLRPVWTVVKNTNRSDSRQDR